MKNKKFIMIASCLGIAIPVSLFAATDENESLTKSALKGNKPSIMKNEVESRIVSMYSSTLLEDAAMPVHANYHTDAGGHTDSHSNLPHTNNHTDKAGGYLPGYPSCSEHTNSHTNRDGYDNHTDKGGNHTDKHTNRDC